MQPVGHSDYVLQQLCSQLEYGFLCDCSIAVGDVHFRAHRVVLAACSSYFHKLFVNQPADSSRLALSTQAVSPEHFDLILQLMYTGRLPAPPADPERFRASLSFLKLYNAGWFPDSAAADHASAAEERDKGDGDASGPSEPLVFCVQLCQDEGLGAPTATAADRPPEAAGRSYPDAIKAEAPEGERQQPFLCHQCGLDFEEHRQLRDHLRMHAQQPFRCPLCGLAFERPLTLQEHMAGCLRGRAAEEEEPSPRAGGGGRPCLANGGARAAAAISKASGPGLRTPKPEEPLPPVGLSGVAVACVGSPGASSPPPPVLKRPKLEEPEPTPPPLPGLGAPEPEDYELEEGEVRFPGLDNLVLQNDISADDDDDDDSFSSFDSSLDGDSAGEPSDDEGVPGGAGDKVPAVGGGGGGGGLAGRPACQTCCVFRSGEEERCHGARHLTTRRLGKAWRCRACEACRPAVKQPKGPPGPALVVSEGILDL
uniref:hypermethylated in cancer 1 protein-like isoform X2 n=1 Tax=Pristiophorus japonicus TaxID=55135 RepID=UPI00398E9DB6